MFNHFATGNTLYSVVLISRFNKGEANKIFDEVAASGCKIVVKNNKLVCVLLSPERYEAIMETLSDYMLFVKAEKRLGTSGSNETVHHRTLLANLGICETELADIKADIE